MSDVRATPTAGLGKLVAIAIGAFVLTFSLVPLYRVACEKVFGIRLYDTPNGQPASANAAAASVSATGVQRVITVQFDGTPNPKLPWDFRPEQTTLQVVPGKMYEAKYFARNDGKGALVGSAAPSIAPSRASGYFNKTECFCFTAQTLQAGESRDMPVRFYIDPRLPDDIHTITLSYTFYRNDALTAQLAQPSHAGAP